MKQTREPAVAGLFYPGGAEELKAQVTGYLAAHLSPAEVKPQFLVVPHAGYSYSGPAAGSAFAKIKSYRYKKVVLLGPSHHFSFQGAAATDDQVWSCPVGNMKVTRPSGWERVETRYHVPEHSLEVQIPFLCQLLPEAVVIPLLCSGPLSSASQLAGELAALWEPDCLWVISSDMNHVGPRFGFLPRDQGYASGAAMDKEAIQLICGGDPKKFEHWATRTGATICGALPMLVMMWLNQQSSKRRIQLSSYDNSSSTQPGPDSVGYGAFYG